MNNQQQTILNDFLDGLRSGVYCQLSYYNPSCMLYDGITEHVPGVLIQAISRVADGGLWSEGVCLIPFAPDENTSQLALDCLSACRNCKWIQDVSDQFTRRKFY